MPFITYSLRVAPDTPTARFIEIKAKVEKMSQTLTLEDVQNMKHELTVIAEQPLSTVIQEEIKKLKDEINLLEKALQAPEHQIMQFKTLLSEIRSIMYQFPDIKTVKAIEKVQKKIKNTSLSTAQKLFLTHRLNDIRLTTYQ